jgi:hypothetical protein
LGYDAYKHNDGQEVFYKNRYVQLEDSKNRSVENNWINSLKNKDYQAILPLPYTHVGSENIWITNETDIQNQAYILSLKTGLPLMSVSLSRTSLSQTFKSYQVIQEALRFPDYLNDLKTNKDVLILAKKDALSTHEKELLDAAKFIAENKNYQVYSLSVAALKNRNPFTNIKHEFETTPLFKTNSKWLSSSEKHRTVLTYFTEKKSEKKLQLNTYTTIIEASTEKLNSDSLTISCWISNFTEDLVPRTSFEIQFFDSKGAPGTYIYQQFKDGFKVLDGHKALIEFPVILKPTDVRFKITCWNENLQSEQKTVFLTDLLIRSTNANVFWWNEKRKELAKNNRTYFPKWN